MNRYQPDYKRAVAAEAAYTSYCMARKWVAFNGEKLKPWNEVDPEIQAAWSEAAEAAQGTLDVLELIKMLRGAIESHFVSGRMRSISITQLDLSEAMLLQAAQHENGSMPVLTMFTTNLEVRRASRPKDD